jgi:hypothetical protein
MAVVRAEVEIDAPPERVFDILEDLASYPEWNPFTPKVESTLQLGDPVHLTVRLRSETKLMQQVEYVTANERPHKLCWGANIGARFLCRAERCQTLTPLPGERTSYVCTDEIQGWLTPIVMRFFGPAMQRGFEDCAFALKKRAEG